MPFNFVSSPTSLYTRSHPSSTIASALTGSRNSISGRKARWCAAAQTLYAWGACPHAPLANKISAKRENKGRSVDLHSAKPHTRARGPALPVLRRPMSSGASRSTDEEIQVSIAIHTDLIGRIIGLRGARIRKYEDESGASIRISKNVGERLRFAFLSGRPRDVSRGCFLVAQGLRDNGRDERDAASRDRPFELNIICPGKLVGYVIGRAGRDINRIRSESRANITISDFASERGSRDQSILIQGSARDIEIAAELLCERMAAGKAGVARNFGPRAAAASDQLSVGTPPPRRDRTPPPPLPRRDAPPRPLPRAGAVSPVGPRSLDEAMVQAALAGVDTKEIHRICVVARSSEADRLANLVRNVENLSGCDRVEIRNARFGLARGSCVVDMSGPVTGIVIALNILALIFREGSRGPDLELTLLVPTGPAIGQLMGTNGNFIKSIRAEAECNVIISEIEADVQLDKRSFSARRVRIEGSPDSVSRAISRVVYRVLQPANQEVTRKRKLSQADRGENWDRNDGDRPERHRQRRRRT